MFADELARTSAQRWRAIVALVATAVGFGFASRWARKGRRRRWVLALFVPVVLWCASFAFWYAPAQLAGRRVEIAGEHDGIARVEHPGELDRLSEPHGHVVAGSIRRL